MIQELNIKNIALIRELTIDLKEGLNVLSGETGAGKSIIVDSVSLILGARADKELIKHGEEKAYVEALVALPDSSSFFEELNDLGVEAEGDMIVSRELSVSGKNVCRINGRLVTLSVLREVMGKLINLHGQDESREVMLQQNQLVMLDSYIGEQAEELKTELRKKYADYISAKKQLDELKESSADKLRTMDMLSYQIKELENAALCEGEEDELISRRSIMQNAEKLAGSLFTAKEELNGRASVLEKLFSALNELKSSARVDASLEALAASVEDCYYTLEDIAEQVSVKAESLNFEPDELEQLEDRLALIRSMKRKYGATERDCIDFLAEIKQKYEKLDNLEFEAGALEKQLTAAKKALAEDCAALSALRKANAKQLEQLIDKELCELGMPAARFTVKFELGDVSRQGVDDVEFFVTLNEGEPAKPLAKVASGGEASRIMLAFKRIMADKQQVSTLIFDEIDTGISGRMAMTVAKKMAGIARTRQVICVSHLPQIAAMSDNGYLIEKSVDDMGTRTDVKKLSAAEKVAEVARLSGGSATQAALIHAQELISECESFKKGL